MKCEHCGKELKEVGVLERDELQDWLRSGEMQDNAVQALKPEVIEKMKFSDGQVFEYFRACFDELAKANFLRYLIRRDLKNKYGFTDEFFVKPDTGKVYVHAE